MPINIYMFWSDLLDKIKANLVIPVIGPNLIEVLIDECIGPLEAI